MLKKIALGTVQFGLPYGISNISKQKTSLSESRAIVNYAKSIGIDTVDTAIAYGDSESCLGKCGIGSLKVISKLPSIPDECSDIHKWVLSSIEKSLFRLNVNKIYGLLLHQPEQLLKPYGKELYQTLDSLKESGLVNKIGVSIYSPEELDILCQKYNFDIVQSPFNILDQRLHKTGWLEQLSDKNIEVHVRSVFLQGLLLMNKHERPEKFNRWISLWDKWDKLIMESNLSPLQACINYVLSFPDIDRVIVGVNTLEQLQEIIRSLNRDIINLPNDLYSIDPDLINPSRWHQL